MVASLLYDGSHVFVDVARVEYFNVLFHDAKSICCSVFFTASVVNRLEVKG